MFRGKQLRLNIENTWEIQFINSLCQVLLNSYIIENEVYNQLFYIICRKAFPKLLNNLKIMFSFHFSQDIKSLLSPLLRKRLLNVFCRRINENNILDPSIGKIKNSAGVYWMNYLQALFFNGVLENVSYFTLNTETTVLKHHNVPFSHSMRVEWVIIYGPVRLSLFYLLGCYSISLASPVLGYNPIVKGTKCKRYFSSSISSLK